MKTANSLDIVRLPNPLFLQAKNKVARRTGKKSQNNVTGTDFDNRARALPAATFYEG